MLKGKTSLDYTNEYKKEWQNNIKMFSIIKKFFLGIDFKKVRMRKIYCTKCKKCKEFKKPKIWYICDKTFRSEDEKVFKEEESIEILKILSLITSIEEYQKIYNHLWRKHNSRV